MTIVKKGVCYCGGNVIIIWGTVLRNLQQDSQPYSPSPKKEKMTQSIGPVCEECGTLYSPFFWQEREIRRQEIIEKAVQTADRIIMDGSDGSEEETNFLIARVAEKFLEKAFIPVYQQMRKKDFSDENNI